MPAPVKCPKASIQLLPIHKPPVPVTSSSHHKPPLPPHHTTPHTTHHSTPRSSTRIHCLRSVSNTHIACITVSQRTTTPLYHCTSASMNHCTSAPLHHCITVSLHNETPETQIPDQFTAFTLRVYNARGLSITSGTSRLGEISQNNKIRYGIHRDLGVHSEKT